MKNFINILVILISTGLISCTNKTIRIGEIVEEKESYSRHTCFYTVRGKLESPFNLERPSFYAPCSLYEIGDTIKFCK